MFYRMRLLEKWQKKYHGSIINSWKYIIKTLIRSRKNAIKKQENALISY